MDGGEAGADDCPGCGRPMPATCGECGRLMPAERAEPEGESVDCPHCGRAIELPMAVEEGAVLKVIREPRLGRLGGPMAH